MSNLYTPYPKTFMRPPWQHYLKKFGLNNSFYTGVIITEPTPLQNVIEGAFVKKVREATEANLSDASFTVEQLCKRVFLSHSQLHRKLEAVTGLSPAKFIRTIRMHKAKELLLSPSHNIASIAHECGYSDAGYFSRVFKRENGVTPQEWRMSNPVVE